MPNATLPEFNTAFSGFLALPSDLVQKYSDVVTQIFPLKASMSKLQEFCDRYLNLSKDLPVKFKPAAPWVLMQVVDYGKMAVTSANVGWFSQHELAFGVPVRWYKKEKGEWVFADWAMVFPFIYVDNPLSMSGGRKIYGWSKAGIKVDTTSAILEPGNLRRLASISLVTAGTNYGDRSGAEEFLQIFQSRPFVSARSAASDLFSIIPRAIANTITAASSIFETTGGFPLGYTDDRGSLQEMLARFYGLLNVFSPESYRAPQKGSGAAPFNIVTMKQIREVSSQGACFQAVVGSKMQIDRTIDGGYLFDPLSADSSGGIHIHLLDAKAQPIMQTLGIESSGNSMVEGKQASTIRPMMPLWLKMDLGYGLADSQWWRTVTTDWTDGDKPNQIPHRPIPYLNLGSGASEEVRGPYHFPNITLRVMPLRAEKTTLQDLLDKHLGNDFFKFEATGQINLEGKTYAVISLIGANFEKMTANGTPGIHYSDRELAFAAPVLWWDKTEPDKKRPALIPLYIFAGTDWNIVTSYEVYGQLSLKSLFVNSDNSWLVDPVGPRKPEPLLTVKTELFPELGKSQEARNLTVLEIFSAEGASTKGSIPEYLKQLGLEHFVTGNEFHSISLKQVMDAKHTSLANYQAVVALLRKFMGVNDQKRAPAIGTLSPLEIKVYEYPTFSMVKSLGLIPDSRNTTGPYPIDTLKPIDPFWVSGTMSGDAGSEMCWRTGINWQRS